MASDPLTKRLALEDYLGAIASEHYRLGLTDCVMTAAQWIKRLHNIDPAASYRGAYRTADESRLLVKRLGGFMPMASAVLDAMFDRAPEPETGDVGIVIAPQALKRTLPVVGALMAIRRDRLWIIKAEVGFAGLAVDAVAIWRT